jgi:copper homeostasis protein
VILEVICCSLADAVAARDGGADRLEICSRLDLQGLTPPVEMVRDIVQEVSTPARVMIRVNDGFLADGAAVAARRRQVTELAPLPIEGIVFGFVDESDHLDFPRMDLVLRAAPEHWKWTLHRVFDYAGGSAAKKLGAVAQHGRADRILTGESWRLAPPAGLQFIAGGGLEASNLREAMNSPCREFHFGRAARVAPDPTAPVDANRVRELRKILDKGRSKGVL